MLIENPHMLLVGSTLQMGKYRIDRYLSSGGFGNTYAATNMEFDEVVAIKEFFMKGISERESDTVSVSVSNLASRPVFQEQLEKFKKEARRLRKMNCKHIVKVHDLFEENGTAYYVMDFIDGESLKELMMRTKQPLPEQQVRAILPQILEALEEVHGQGIWHLDLKPANIMIDKQGTASLVDFGASKQMKVDGGGATTSTTASYTAGYAPSEQIDGRMDLVGNWTDLYGLGATLYKLLTDNKPPMLSDILAMKDEAFIYPPGVSQQMRQLIRWMMQVDRAERPQSVAEVRAFLEGAAPNAQDAAAEETVPVGMPPKPVVPPTPAAPPTPKAPETPVAPKKPAVPKEPVKPNAPIAPGTPSSPSSPYEPAPKKSKLPLILAVVLGLLLMGGGAWYFLAGDKTAGKPDVEETEDRDRDGDDEKMTESADVKKVEGQQMTAEYYDGKTEKLQKVDYTYTGPTVNDRAEGIGRGEYDMGTYEGAYKAGLREGKGTFTFKESGDTFEGTFKDDLFEKGVYVEKASGQYFEGEFQSGNFYNGDWYNADKTHYAKVVEGKEIRE